MGYVATCRCGMRDVGIIDPLFGPLCNRCAFKYIEHLRRLCRQFLDLCKTLLCRNAGRYDSGYCGICDILHNEGRGELKGRGKLRK